MVLDVIDDFMVTERCGTCRACTVTTKQADRRPTVVAGWLFSASGGDRASRVSEDCQKSRSSATNSPNDRARPPRLADPLTDRLARHSQAKLGGENCPAERNDRQCVQPAEEERRRRGDRLKWENAHRSFSVSSSHLFSSVLFRTDHYV